MLIRMLAVLVLHGSMVPVMIVSVLIVDGEIDPSFGEIAPFFVAAAFPAGVAVAVWCLAPWAARLMIRVPRVSVCPNCRYRLEGLMAPQCMECGYTLTPEFLTSSAERATGVSEPDTVLLRQIATLVMRLIAGALVPISAIASFANATSAIERPQWNTWTPVFAWCAVFMFTTGVFLSASRLSFVLVPGRRAFQKRVVPRADVGRADGMGTPDQQGGTGAPRPG